jgi:hypothetical protein
LSSLGLLSLSYSLCLSPTLLVIGCRERHLGVTVTQQEKDVSAIEPMSGSEAAASATATATATATAQLSASELQRKRAQFTGNWSQDSSTFAEMEKLQAVTGHPWLLRKLTAYAWTKLHISVDQHHVNVCPCFSLHRSIYQHRVICSCTACPPPVARVCFHRYLSSLASPSGRCGVAASAAHFYRRATGASGLRLHARRSMRNVEQSGSRTGL